jgi:aspartyl protease family protein
MKELPHTLKLATVWLLIGTALFLAVQYWQAQQRQSLFSARGGVIELQRAADGHFHWPGQVNGVAVDFLVDTGATRSALPAALAERAGLQAEGTLRSDTAGGTVQGQVARATLQLQGGVRLDRLPVAVLPDLRTPLLGMDVLSRLRFTQQDGVLRLQPPSTDPL